MLTNVWWIMKRLSGLILLSLIVTGVCSCGGEREGYIETSDCRETVYLGHDSFEFQKLYKNFTCTGSKEKRICIRVEMDSGKCQTAYIYSYASSYHSSFTENSDRPVKNDTTNTKSSVAKTEVTNVTPPAMASEDTKFKFTWFDNDISELTTNVCTVRKNFDMAGRRIKTCYQANWEPWVNLLLSETVGPPLSDIDKHLATQGSVESVLQYPDGSKSLVFRGCHPNNCDKSYVYFFIEPNKKTMDVIMRNSNGQFEYYGPNEKAMRESNLAKLLKDQNNIFINSRTYLLPDQ